MSPRAYTPRRRWVAALLGLLVGLAAQTSACAAPPEDDTARACTEPIAHELVSLIQSLREENEQLRQLLRAEWEHRQATDRTSLRRTVFIPPAF